MEASDNIFVFNIDKAEYSHASKEICESRDTEIVESSSEVLPIVIWRFNVPQESLHG